MAKRPDHMTPEERLTRILSLERKVWELERRVYSAEREAENTLAWGRSAFQENRRLTDRLRELIERLPFIIQSDIDAAHNALAEAADSPAPIGREQPDA